ncbi:hypothetical protein GCM10007866_12610 [Gluconobacter albidus]|uniref:Uncharacterized protein n=1 Tax=Gluconobacter albidus TaxID=318683 RepID=A0ABQ5X1N1_9PROT|nr:hypothetical protein AA3250_0651 [Gluconobacter albidus NBRC 3250]GLQ68810.1 hypothetical protein GCM10007866_12610 [Gluconobacter albidus]
MILREKMTDKMQELSREILMDEEITHDVSGATGSLREVLFAHGEDSRWRQFSKNPGKKILLPGYCVRPERFRRP